MRRNHWLAIFCLLLGFQFQIDSADADEIGFIEKFALAADREAVLKELIPGTEDYYYFHCLHYQNTEQFDKVDTMLNRWIKSFDYKYRAKQSISAKAREIVNRQMILTYSQNPKKSLEYLETHLNLKFDHQRERLDGPSLPSVLDPVLIERKTLTERALARYSNIQGFEQSALAWLLDEKLDRNDMYYALARVNTPDHPKLVELLDPYLSNDVHEFGTLSIHRLLTKQQLLKFANLRPRLMDNNNFVNIYLSKIRPNPDVHFDSDKDAQKTHLTELWDFAKRLQPAYNTLKAHVLYQRLLFDRSVGLYDRERFMEYIKLPREASYIETKYHRQREFNNIKINFNQNYKTQTLYPTIGNDEPLIRSYLHHFFVEDQDYKQYEKYIRESYLKRNFAETKIVNGLGDPEKWASYISAVDYKNLRDRVDLDFSYTSRERYDADDAVSIEVNVKNVQKLIVKIFEINTSNFYRDQRREIDTNIELDGLLPNKEYTFQYDDSPFRRIKRKIDLKELDKRGVYIVDFIGNRKSSRALIRKGRLRYIEEVTPAGHKLTIVNENNDVVKDASVWMIGSQYQADENGNINIPFSTRPGRVPLVISKSDFSSFDNFTHQAESYSLNVGFYVDRESLINGQKASVIVRPQIAVNGIPASIKLLDDVRLMISSTDLDGSISTKEVKDFELFEDRESEYDFKVPKRLQGLTFRLSGKIRNLSQAKDINLSASDSFYLNRIDTDVKVEDLHLSKIAGQYFIDLLGKTGEMRAGRSVQISVKHRDFKDPVGVALQTGMNGRIKLGPLSEIASLTVSGAEGTSRVWNLLRPNHSYYSSIFAAEGDAIEVPLSKFDTTLTHQDVALLEMRSGTYVRNMLDKVKLTDGILTISGLKKGDYQLVLKNVQNINLKITKGKKLNGLVINNNRQLELKRQKPIQIKAIDRNKNKTLIQLTNADKFARVHVVATRYVPRFELFKQLLVNDAEPGLTLLPQSRSVYVAGRKIGDEYQYILDRKYAEKYPGVMLKRPGLLLQPWAVRTTETTRQSADAGTQFGSGGGSGAGAFGRGSNAKRSAVTNTDESNLDFLQSGSIVITNLVADENGRIEIDNELFGGLQHIHVCAVTPTNSAARDISFGEAPMDPSDLRLALGLDPEKRYARKKEITLVDKDKTFDITDIATGEFELYDNLPNVYRLFTSLRNDSKLAEFRFILDWQNKKFADKLELYSKYGCHELNFFLFKRDPNFFEQVVQPYIVNKKDKTFLDHYLLNSDLSDFAKPWEFNQLNTVERILMSQVLDAEPQYTSRYVRESYFLSPTPQSRFDSYFGFAIQGNALETEGNVISGGLTKLRGSMEDDSREKLGLSAAKNSPTRPMSNAKPAPSGAAERGGRDGGGMGGGGAGSQSRGRNRFAEKSQPEATEGAAEPSDKYAPSEAKKKMDSLSRRSRQQGKDTELWYDNSMKSKRKEMQQLFRQVDKTQEWAENNYYKLPIQQQNSGLVKVNQFWRDYAAHQSDSPFYSVNVAEASNNFTEMMFALSVLDLEWKPGKHKSETQDNKLTLTAASPLLMYHDQIRPAKDGRKETSVLVSQNFFQVNDRYRYEGPDRLDKFVTDEFIKQTAYGCQVVVTNPTSAKQKIDLLLQIPRGSMPLKSTKETRSVHLELDPYRTSSIEYFFYFPESGDYAHYPVNVAKNEEVIAFAESTVFNVVDQPSKIDKTSWAYISQFGTEQEVLDYLDANNLQRTDMNKIAWRMKEKSFFNQIVSYLGRNHIYNPTLWAYGVKHNAAGNIRQFLNFSDSFVNTTGPYIDAELLTNDRVARKSYEHLEYDPLINARAHQLGKQRQILNNRFYAQYHRLLWIAGCKRKLGDHDLMALTYYMILQDRISEAQSFFAGVNSESLKTRLQYDYMAAYLDMFNEKPDVARAISNRYANYRVDRWRKAFLEIANQLNEIDGKSTDVVDNENRENVLDSVAAKTSSFDFKVDAKQIELNFQNMKRVQVNYYVMDVELLFSRNPFVQEFSGELTYIRPKKSEWVELPESGVTHKWALPKELDRSNVLVEISGGEQVKSQAYYAHAMNVQMIEKFGQLKVADAKSGRQVPKTYCKVYAQMKDGTARFYKDGYTDLRGRFDYTSLSTNDLDNVNKFSILVMSDELGATVREAIPPKR